MEPYDTFCISGGGVRAALTGLIVLDELSRPDSPPAPSSFALVHPPALPNQPADSGNDMLRTSISPPHDTDAFENIVNTLDQQALPDLRNALQQATDTDGFNASWDSWAKRPSGIDAIADLHHGVGLAIPPANTYGVSGGGWGVLVNEAVGARQALINILGFFKVQALRPRDKRLALGTSFGGLSAVEAELTNQTLNQWIGYTSEFLDVLLSPYSAAICSEYGTLTEGARVKSILHEFAVTAKVVIGTGSLSGHEFGHLIMERGGGSLSRSAHYFGEPALSRDTWQGDVYFVDRTSSADQQRLLDRLWQAVFGSTAYFFVQSKLPLSSQTFGYPANITFNRSQFDRQSHSLTLWDMGIRCNIPLTHDQLMRPGTSFVVDASEDDHLFQSLDTATEWSQSQGWVHQYTGISLLKLSTDAAGPITWFGRKLKFDKLVASDFKNFVRVYKAERNAPVSAADSGPTLAPRYIVAIALGQLIGKSTKPQTDSESRFASITTLDVPESWFARHLTFQRFQARIFEAENFDTINIDVRKFYRKVLELLGLPFGQFDVDGAQKAKDYKDAAAADDN